MTRYIVGFGLLAGVGLGAASASASPITFVAGNITADSDVSNVGTTVAAFNAGGPASTVNGVAFSAFDAAGTTSTTVGNTTLSTNATGANIGSNSSSFGPPSSTLFPAISSSYGTLLQSADYQDVGNPNSTFTLTFSNLTPGQAYLFQSFVNDSRGPGAGGSRTEEVSGPTGSVPAELAYDVGNVAGGAGQYSLGTFIADSSGTQTVTITGTSTTIPDTQLNAFQLRAVPEPASLGLLGIGAVGLLARRRRVC